MQPTHSTHKHSALKRKPIKRHQHCVLSCVLSSCCVCPWVCVCVWQRGKVINILFYSNWLAMISQNWLDIPIASDEYIFYSLFTHRMNWEITSVSHCNRFNSHRSHLCVCVCVRPNASLSSIAVWSDERTLSTLAFHSLLFRLFCCIVVLSPPIGVWCVRPCLKLKPLGKRMANLIIALCLHSIISPHLLFDWILNFTPGLGIEDIA